jgi:Putative zinc-finger
MNCQKAGELLSAYIDGEVNGRESEALEAHLGHCESCCEELETLHSAIALLEAPKTLVQPEGLLEEFKAKYRPEVDAAPAPRWGIRLPVIPRFEWPSLGQMLLPMGGLAAAAAAALVVGLHTEPMLGRTAPPQPLQTSRRVAVLPTYNTDSAISSHLSGAVPAIKQAVAMHTMRESGTPVHVVSHRETTPGRHHSQLANAPAVTPHRHYRHRPRTTAEGPGLRPVRHRAPRPGTYTLANSRLMAAPPVSEPALAAAVGRHQQAEPSPEMQWQDQVVVIQRRAMAAPADDGYAEASYKDVTTGVVTRSAAIGTPTEATAAPGGDNSGGGK